MAEITKPAEIAEIAESAGPAAPAYLAAVRESYDTVAAAYAELVPPPAALDPLSRAMLDAFAEETAGAGPVADVGCGPGRITAYLAERGVQALGFDLSGRMAELAGGAYPHLPFAVASMTALPVRDGALAGLLAYYSTHHTPPALLPDVFAEFRRALAPGGLLMLAGHIGTGERRRPTEAYGGLPVSYESHRLPAARIAALLGAAGLAVTARLEEERYVTFRAKRRTVAG
ncbi:class I SAM-dependent methyltransferase [Streptomyces sp. NPDC048717]|uniref:class I SAM-dependent methyltransferase n=1 Tax=Streptomyces sp. NPDC048717 TaxID=3154928 RepID=UPI0034175738